MLISQAQVEWIISHIQSLIVRYNGKTPLTDAEWESLMSEAREIERKSRRHPLAVQLVVAVLKYFEEVNQDE